MEELAAFLHFTPRDAGTDGARRAADYLAQRLAELGLDPVVDEFEDVTPEGPAVFRNVLGVINDTADGPVVVVASHYDTKRGIAPPFTGANDSGSSTAVLLELARLLGPSGLGTLRCVLAFLDGEECIDRYGPNDGLHGSRRLASTLVRNQRAGDVCAVIVIDMIGDRDLTVTIPRNSSPELIALAFQSAHEEGIRDRFSLHDGYILDDHVPFLDSGMPAVDLIDFHYGSGPGLNDYWHTPGDTIDKVSAASLESVGRVLVRMLNHLADRPLPPAD